MIKCNHINPYKSKVMAIKAKYRTADGPYKTTRDVKVPFRMPEFSRRDIIAHLFHIEKLVSW